MNLFIEKLGTSMIENVVLIKLLCHKNVVGNIHFEEFLSSFPSGSFILEQKDNFYFYLLVEAEMYKSINEVGLEELANMNDISVVTKAGVS